MKCYYDNEQCEGQLWQCQTCGGWYCQWHGHVTGKGTNVECVACEYSRKEEEEEACRWQNPYDWLAEASRDWTDEMVREEFLSMAQSIGFDAIQEMYESYMDQDGYFEGEEEGGGDHDVCRREIHSWLDGGGNDDE